MPAYTIAQLEDVLGKYAESRALSFREMMSQLLPRIYRMGMWPDLAYEVSLSGQYGYISLPLDTAGVLACTVNDRPRPTRSLWHDVRISGRNASLSAYYGIVDDGYHPVILDMKDVQGVDAEGDVVGPTELRAMIPSSGGSQILAAEIGGTVVISIIDENGTTSVMDQNADTYVTFTPVLDGVVRITGITYNDILTPFDLVDPDFPTKVIATIPAGSGVLRFRRFRTPEKSPSCTVHLLLKRDAPGYIGDDTVVHLGNIGAIKNAMLAIIDEDNADRARAKDLWMEVEKILDKELQAVMGSAKPTLKLDFGPCPPIQSMM